MATLKTLVNDANVEDFINSVDNETRRADSIALLKLYGEVTNEKPKMWGTSIVGYGQYHYKSERSSQEGDWPLMAFSPRKQNLTLYFTPGFDKYKSLLDKLGRHKTSKGCLYINKLRDIDQNVLKELLEQEFVDAKAMYLTK